jgi:hypothetical protein
MRKTVPLLACGMAAVALVGVGTGAAARAKHGPRGPKATTAVRPAKAAKRLHAVRAFERRRAVSFLVRTAAAYLGLTRAKLVQQLAGHSLAEVAVANGKTSAGLQEALVAAVKAKLDTLLQKGRITQAQHDALLPRLRVWVAALVNHRFGERVAKHGARHHRLARHALLKVAAAYLGITVAQLRQQLPGHSLADVAAANGKTAAGLQQALVAAVKARLEKLVAARRITQARADALLARFERRVGKLVTRVWPSRS